MKRFTPILLFLVALLFSASTFAQKVNVNGSILDTTGQPMPGATVMLLQAQDSVLTSFAISTKDGDFKLFGVPGGEYRLQVSFVGHELVDQSLSIDPAAGNVTVPAIKMEPAKNELGEFTVEGEITPMKFKEDTVEYNAGAFKTQEHAVVEDLLKQLPGVEIEDDGTVKAQGEEVTKVYVDGKEFFGDDPKLATKNLPADAIDKVQVYDKKSDFSEFSGIDDGERQKTINLLLKEDRKQGYFGVVEGGYGAGPNADNRYKGKANINRFDKKKQISLLAMSNNINEQGFSFRDYINFVGGVGALMGQGGRGGLNQGLGLPVGMGASDGFMQTGAGGLNLNMDLGEKTEWRSSYFLNALNHVYDREVNTEYLLDSLAYREDEVSATDNSNVSHRLNLRLKHEIDTTSELVFNGSASYSNTDAITVNRSSTILPENILANSSDQDYRTNGTNLNLNGDLSYRKRFKRKGRTFSTKLTTTVSENDTRAELLSYNFFNTDTVDFFDTVDQNQNETNDVLNYGLSAIYTEPVGKRQFLRFEVSRERQGNAYQKDFLDRIDGQEIFNDSLSVQYDRVFDYSRAGANFQLVRKKWNLTFGVDGQISTLNGEIISNGQTITQEFRNLLPSLRYFRNFSQYQRLDFNYQTSVNEPSLTQLQPTIDNTDPLNVYVGNPDLLAEYSHTGSLNFRSFSQFSFTSIFVRLRGVYTTNKITNQTFINPSFVQTTQPVNVDRDLNMSLFGSYSTPMRPLKTRIRINANASYNNSILFVNRTEDQTNRYTVGGDLSLDNLKKEKIDLRVGLKLSYNLTEYQRNSNLDQSFLNRTYYARGNVTLLEKYNLEGQADYQFYPAGEAFGQDQTVLLLHAGLSRFLLPGKRGQLKFSVHDILNQNLGVTRTTQLNYIQEERVSSLGRYFMLSFSYKIITVGKGKKKRNEEEVETEE